MNGLQQRHAVVAARHQHHLGELGEPLEESHSAGRQVATRVQPHEAAGRRPASRHLHANRVAPSAMLGQRVQQSLALEERVVVPEES